ncbi:uncharacterized protein HD556DRAFT_175354 [Suillus plorans]|uniref:Uncharacterized protein n=1 Tax=Suillus plorans TaxID=116603 RepID=A0A9P7D9Z1_9AGAM|nr:uncharacterized protein HD556DRAFT_175354 [Suillus plorans]KAG1784949.1 hypothetical protein HD556DRAFT_175354 [Suillus plorans]
MKLAFGEAFRRCQLQSLYRVRVPGRLQQPVLVRLLRFSRPTYSPHTHRILSTKHSLCDVETADLFDYSDPPARTPKNMDFAHIMETTTRDPTNLCRRREIIPANRNEMSKEALSHSKHASRFTRVSTYGPRKHIRQAILPVLLVNALSEQWSLSDICGYLDLLMFYNFKCHNDRVDTASKVSQIHVGNTWPCHTYNLIGA